MSGERASSAGDHRRWERFAPAGALGFLVTVAAGAIAVGEGSPSGDAPAQEIAEYFAEHQGGHILDAVLVVFGAFVSTRGSSEASGGASTG